MEHGVGRLMTAEERRRWPDGEVRSAFAIGGGHVLTAWHCVSAIGGVQARLWLRLQSAEDDEFVDVPVRYRQHSTRFDAALLDFDDERAGGELRALLDSVALPLGTEVVAHDDVRVFGFPERNVAAFATAHRGRVSTVNSRIGTASAIRVQLDALAARHPESPHGMSGGPLARTYPDGDERVVGIVSSFPPAGPERRDALGGTLLCRRINDLQHEFTAVADALRRAPRPPRGDEAELSPDVVAASRALFEAAAVAPPARFTLRELQAAQPRQASRLADRVHALRWAVAAKPVLIDIGAHELEIGQLQVIYRREVGRWPTGGSLDALLVEGAEVALNESRTGWRGGLGALARFAVGTAAALAVPPREHPVLARWLEEFGHQIADAQRYYLERHGSTTWLLIDLGDEPAPGATPWPARVVCTHFVREGQTTSQLTQEVTAVPTAAGLRDALRGILRAARPASALFVDIAMPYALLDKGIEHWPVVEVDGEWEPLSGCYSPRLRWSLRRHDLTLYRQCVKRTTQSNNWAAVPEPLLDDLLLDTTRLKRWVRGGTCHAWLVGAHPLAAGASPLRVLLREGCGFLVWFPAGGDDGRGRRIVEAVSEISVDARRRAIPDELPVLDLDPVVIWDDPRGRDEFELPPLVPTQPLQAPQR